MYYYAEDFLYAFIRFSPILFTILLSLLMSWVFIIRKKNRHKETEELFKLLSNNYEKCLINDKDDIVILLNSIGRKYTKNYALASILEDYIVYLTSNENSKNIDVKNSCTLIKEIIKIENQEKPFINVPDEEKRILMSINENVKYNDVESIKMNLHELATVLSTRNRIYKRTELINRWAITIAVVGIVLTIIFGLFGFKSIDYNKIEDIIKENLIEKSIQE